jgi:hypothetical protein
MPDLHLLQLELIFLAILLLWCIIICHKIMLMIFQLMEGNLFRIILLKIVSLWSATFAL